MTNDDILNEKYINRKKSFFNQIISSHTPTHTHTHTHTHTQLHTHPLTYINNTHTSIEGRRGGRRI